MRMNPKQLKKAEEELKFKNEMAREQFEYEQGIKKPPGYVSSGEESY